MDPVFVLLAGFLVFAPTPELRLAAFHDLEMYFLLCMRAGAPPRQDPPRLSIRKALGGPLYVDQLPNHVFPRLFRFTREEFPLLVQAYNIPGVLHAGSRYCILGRMRGADGLALQLQLSHLSARQVYVLLAASVVRAELGLPVWPLRITSA